MLCKPVNWRLFNKRVVFLPEINLVLAVNEETEKKQKSELRQSRIYPTTVERGGRKAEWFLLNVFAHFAHAFLDLEHYFVLFSYSQVSLSFSIK